MKAISIFLTQAHDDDELIINLLYSRCYFLSVAFVVLAHSCVSMCVCICGEYQLELEIGEERE